MRWKSFAFFTLIVGCASLAACQDWIDELSGEEEEEEEESPTPGESPTPSIGPTPEETPVTTVDGDITTVDWGTQDLEAGSSPRFQFTAPAGTIGIDFMAIGAAADQGKVFGFFGVEGPDGVVINNSANGPARQAFALGAMSFAVPSDDSATTAAGPGAWEFAVFAGDESSLLASTPRVLVKIRTAPGGTVPTGELDLNVFLVAGVGLTAAADCQTGSALFDALSYASGLFAAGSSGLSLLNVACYDLPQSSFADIGSEDELGDLFETSSSAADARLNLYVVSSFSGDFTNVAGIAGSVPIPMAINGTRRSGVAVSYQGGSMVNLGETIAHEIGHSLGLYHTSEFNAATNGFDPISDTAECPSLGSSYGGSGCPDDVNVMFPTLTGDFAGFSQGQLTVLKPTVYVRRQGQPAFAPSLATRLTPIDPRTPGLPAWEGPPVECRNGIMRHRR